MRNFINLMVLKSLIRDERGVSALEYAILAGMIVVAVAAGVKVLAPEILEAFTNLGKSVTTATTPIS